MPDYFIGLDIGTSSTKAVAFDLNGHFLAKKTASCATASPRPGWQEQDPEQILHAALTCLRQIVKEINGNLIGVSISSAMHSLIAMDGQGSVLTPCILWSDIRSAAIASELKGSALGKEIYRHTGTPVHPMTPLCKLAWLRQNQPAIFKKTRQFLGIKEYLVFRLFGEFLTDYSVASATGLFDAAALQWYTPALEFAGVKPDQLPMPVSPFFVLKNLKKEFVKLSGISPETLFIIGASDGCLANLGAGAMSEGTAALTVGTSGALRMTTGKPVYDEKERIFNYLLVENQYVTGGASNNGAVIYEWFTRQFFGVNPSALVMERHRKALFRIPPGSEGLLFLPYLLGERAPVWNAEAKGVFFGINGNHTKAHFHRAVLEGILLNLCLIGNVLEETVAPISRIHANGGFTKDDFWVQMTADVFGKEVRTFESGESSAFGAAILGMKALGLHDDLSAVQAMVLPEKTFLPNEVNHRIYQQSLHFFKKIYRSLEGAFVNSGLSSK